MTLAARRLRNGSITAALLLAVAAAVYLNHVSLRDSGFLTGWLLVGAVAVLTSYNLRKKLPFLPLADSAAWMQLHLYLGLLTVPVFLMHTGVELPNGRLESLLWLLFVGVLASGLAGIVITRRSPRAITEHGERLIYERIPRFRAELALEVERLAADSLEKTASGTISSYYCRRLQPYFARHRHIWHHLVGSKRPVKQLCRELRSLERYLSAEGRETLDAIEARVLAKDNLDFQYVWQSLLKGWLFVHVPMTYAAIVLAAVHIVLVYAFGASQP